jgi:hypothetical protein
MNKDNQFAEVVSQIVYSILKNENLLKSEWHLGEVESVISSTMLNVYVDGAIQSQKIPCNPDVTFNKGDSVFVIIINNDSRNKYVISKRAI